MPASSFVPTGIECVKFADGTGGAYLLSGIDTLAEAQAIVAADPLALQNASDLVVHEWNTR